MAGKILKRIYYLRDEIFAFTSLKGKTATYLTDAEWMAKFAFLVDISGHLNELNLKFKGHQNLAHNLYNHVKAFEEKLTLWQSQISKCNFVHFPTMSECSITEPEEIITLKEEF